MNNLTRLAKLRQYSSGQDVTDYLSKELRQNMLAIESAFRSGIKQDYLLSQIQPISVANNAASDLVFAEDFKNDPFSMIGENEIVMKDNGSYLFEVNLTDLFVSGVKKVTFFLTVNGILQKQLILCDQSTTTFLKFCPYVAFPIKLLKNDRLVLSLQNESSLNTNTVTASSGVLKISKLSV